MARARLLLAVYGLSAAALAAGGVWALLAFPGTRGQLFAVAAALLVAAAVMLAVPSWLRSGLLFEWQVQRTFRAICAEKGLTKKAGSAGLLYPSLSRLSGGSDAFTVTVRPLLGQSLADFERAAAAFSLGYDVAVVRFQVDPGGGGRLVMSVGIRAIESADFAELAAAPSGFLAMSWRERLRRVTVGQAEGGVAFSMPLIDTHVLVAGTTGAGKGSVIWSLMLRLEQAHRQGVVQFWGFDPKRMELAIGRPFFGDTYASEPEAMVELLEAAALEMHARADRMAGHVRRFEPSPEFPLNVLVVDELGYLSALLPDRKLRERAEKALSSVLVLGRSVGFVVVGALQDPRKETLGFRDLFPTRIAMRLPKPMVDLVLGAGAHAAGAQCDLIPLGPDGAGVAFVVDEATTVPVCVRMSWCSDQLIKSVAGNLPAIGFPRLRPVN
jgi:S-DNA-T family DNA segregation ATPase FtsK/SpoIIIE